MKETTSLPYYRVVNGQPKLMKMFILSFIVHALLISLAIAAPSFLKKKADLHPIYMVKLVNPSDLGIRGSSPKARNRVKRKDPKKSSFFKEPKKAPAARKRAQISEARPIILPKAETIPPVKKDWDLEFKKVKSKIEEVKQQKDPLPVRQTPSAWRAHTTLLVEYSLVVKQRVKEGWSFPSTRKTFEAIVSLQVDKDGRLEDIRFEKRSRNSRFDESILRALRKTVLPSPPKGIIGEVFVITFHST